jgi:hypothetical protein
MKYRNLAEASKDELILCMLAVLGGDSREVNERDLFLACWHAFPNTMRWADTALPNPDTFTASLRRLDQRGYIQRIGKQDRQKTRSRRRRTTSDSGRSGVVKARVAEGGLDKAGIPLTLVGQVRELIPDREATKSLSESVLIALCVGLRENEGRQIDESVLVELAFHKFPERFAYGERPEFPDVGRIRAAIRVAQDEGLIDANYQMTDEGQEVVIQQRQRVELRADVSEGYKTGDLKLADRIEQSSAYRVYAEHGTLIATKPDELFRALRVPPTTNPHPVANALMARMRALRRVDKGQVAEYLLSVAEEHNPDVAELVMAGDPGTRALAKTGASPEE